MLRTLIQVYTPQDPLPPGIILPHQTHSTNIVEVITGAENLESCDGIFTQQKGLALGIQTADCAAVALWDDRQYGVFHIGWRGLADGLVEKAVALFDPKSVCGFVAPLLPVFEISPPDTDDPTHCYERLAQRCGEVFFSREGNKTLFHFRDALAAKLPPNVMWDSRVTGTEGLASWRQNQTPERNTLVLSVP